MNDNPHPPTDPVGEPEEERHDAAAPDAIATGADHDHDHIDDTIDDTSSIDTEVIEAEVLDTEVIEAEIIEPGTTEFEIIDTEVVETDRVDFADADLDADPEAEASEEPVLVGVGVPDSASMSGDERPVGGIRPPQPPGAAGPTGGSGPTGATTSGEPTIDQPMPKRLRRMRGGVTREGRMPRLGGVTTGLGRYLGIDAVYLRAVFILLIFFNGFGLLAYIAAWALIPGDDDPRPQPVVPTRSVAGLVIGLAASIGALATIADPFSIDITDLILPLGLIGAGVWFLDRRPDLDPERPAPPAPTGTTSFGSASFGTAPTGSAATPPPPTAFSASATTGDTGTTSHWATPPVATRPSGPPITAISFAATAALLGLTVLLDSFDAIDPSEVFYAAVLCLGFGGGLVASALVKGARSGALIGLSLLSLLTLGLVSVSGPIVFGGIGERTETVVGAPLDDRFRWGIGEYELDLTGADIDRITELDVEQGIGELRIRVPDDVLVQVEADVSGGVITLFGRSTEGSGIDDTIVIAPSGERVGRAAVVEAIENGDPVLLIEASLRFGEVRVTR